MDVGAIDLRLPGRNGRTRSKADHQVDLARTKSSNEVLVELSHGRSPAGYCEGFEIDPTAASASVARLRAQWWTADATALLQQPLIALFVRRHLQASPGRRRSLALLDLMDDMVAWDKLPRTEGDPRALSLIQRFEQLAPPAPPAGRRVGWPLSLLRRLTRRRASGGVFLTG